jgi:hypothetical protein
MGTARIPVTAPGLADACPACFPGDAPAAQPGGICVTADGYLSAGYRCGACGRAWRTAWQVVTAWPVRRTEAGAELTALLDEVIAVLAEALLGEDEGLEAAA